MSTKKDESSPPNNQKMPTKKEEPSQAPQKVPSKKEEPAPAQPQRVPSKKEEKPEAAQQRMPSKKEEPSQGQQGDAASTAAPGAPVAQSAQGAPAPGPALGPRDQSQSRGSNSVLKCGPLFISSKGIGWTSWKKRWFILTHTSLVFFRSDPSAVSQKGNTEVNLTLGGIDLNNSGSVVVKADKKLLTVLFPDGRDGRAFTLKAETLEDLYEWKAALENALSLAPTSAHVMGPNAIFGDDQPDAVDGSNEPVNDKQPVRSTVVGRPVLLALEDVDGSPTFLEKALRFVEEHGVKVEGILRQAADVELVERRIREYEQGKTEFSSDEDAHVIADCVKYIIRELPSYPVPASCCNALLQACRTERGTRVNAMRTAVLDTFPEPNRRLLQRILIMMQNVASHKAKNLMSSSAVAACMAPLLLRPLLSGDCEIENDFDVGGDGSLQLLQAAAAANHAQAIVITLLEEYDKIFGEGSVSPDLYSDSEESGSESEEATEDDDESYEDDEEYDDDEECDDASQESDDASQVSGDASQVSDDDDDDYDDEEEEGEEEEEEEEEEEASGTGSESSHSVNLHDDKDSDYSSSVSESSGDGENVKAAKKLSSSLSTSLSENDEAERAEDNQSSNTSATGANKCAEPLKDVDGETMLEAKLPSRNKITCIPKSSTIGNGPGHNIRPPTWGRTSAKKNLSMESIDFPYDEAEIETLETEKAYLEDRLTEEIEVNATLEASLEKRKKTLCERRLALEKDIESLEAELQRQREKRLALEAALNASQGPIPLPDTIDEKTKADIEDIAQAEADIVNLNKRVDDLEMQLSQQLEQNSVSTKDSYNKDQPNHQEKMKDKPKGTRAAFERSGSKDKHQDEAECKNDKKQESSSENKHPPQNQQLDDSTLISNISDASKKVARKSLSLSSKKSTKSEGANSTTSALTKLTTRLNILKERRSMKNEFLVMDKGQGSTEAVPSSDKSKGPEPDKGRDSSQAVPSSDKGKGPELDKGRGSSQAVPSSDKGKGSEPGKGSELDKGRGSSLAVPSSNKGKGQGKGPEPDKDRGSSQAVPSSDKIKGPRRSSSRSDKGKGPEPDKGRGSSQAVPSSDKGEGADPASPVQNPEKGREPDTSQ